MKLRKKGFEGSQSKADACACTARMRSRVSTTLGRLIVPSGMMHKGAEKVCQSACCPNGS